MNVNDIRKLSKYPDLLEKILKIDSNRINAAQDKMPEDMRQELLDIGIEVTSSYHGFLIMVKNVINT